MTEELERLLAYFSEWVSEMKSKGYDEQQIKWAVKEWRDEVNYRNWGGPEW